MDEGILEIIKLMIGSGGLIGIALTIYKIGRFAEKFEQFKTSINENFNEMENRFNKVDKKLDKLEEILKDQGERLAFLEASSIYTLPLEPPQPNVRSAAAREMWKKRRAKKIEQKS